LEPFVNHDNHRLSRRRTQSPPVTVRGDWSALGTSTQNVLWMSFNTPSFATCPQVATRLFESLAVGWGGDVGWGEEGRCQLAQTFRLGLNRAGRDKKLGIAGMFFFRGVRFALWCWRAHREMQRVSSLQRLADTAQDLPLSRHSRGGMYFFSWLAFRGEVGNSARAFLATLCRHHPGPSSSTTLRVAHTLGALSCMRPLSSRPWIPACLSVGRWERRQGSHAVAKPASLSPSQPPCLVYCPIPPACPGSLAGKSALARASPACPVCCLCQPVSSACQSKLSRRGRAQLASFACQATLVLARPSPACPVCCLGQPVSCACQSKLSRRGRAQLASFA
jgi:hypothetical protein